GLPPVRRSRGGKRRGAPIPLAILALDSEQPCAPALAGDAGTFGRDVLRRRISKVTHHLPADRRVGVQQPLDYIHSVLPQPARIGSPGLLGPQATERRSGRSQRLERTRINCPAAVSSNANQETRLVVHQ